MAGRGVLSDFLRGGSEKRNCLRDTGAAVTTLTRVDGWMTSYDPASCAMTTGSGQRKQIPSAQSPSVDEVKYAWPAPFIRHQAVRCFIPTAKHHIHTYTRPYTMSETEPLLPTAVRKNLPSARQVESYVPSEGSRIQVSQCLGALKAGKMPSQEQISRMIDLVLQSDALKSTGGPSSRTARLGEEGARILDDFKDVLKAFKAWGEGKNDKDLLQNLFYNAATADLDLDLSTSSLLPRIRAMTDLLLRRPLFQDVHLRNGQGFGRGHRLVPYHCLPHGHLARIPTARIRYHLAHAGRPC